MEGLGLVAMEASSCGLPVLASDLEGVKDAVQDSKNGFLVKSEDADGFLQKILDYKGDPQFRMKVREYTIKQFCWDRIALRHLELFQSL